MNNEDATSTIEVVYLDGSKLKITYPFAYFPANVEIWQERFLNGSIRSWKVV
jgi:hypothetical protein